MMKPRKPGSTEPLVRVHWVRHRLVKSKGRKLRVIIYARFSTDDQSDRSIVDQVQYCKKFLFSLGLKTEDLEIIVLSDEAISGEIIFRDGINEVRAKIAAHWPDLIIGEDAGRFFRSASACVEFVETAVDEDIRVICINDEVDTADEEHWEDRLYEAARHHAKSNKFTSRRIERALATLWDDRFSIGLVKPGYRRKPLEEPKAGEPAEGPYVDEIDPELEATIYRIFERIAANEPCEHVGAWLTSISFAKTSNSRTPAWSPRNVIALIRRSDYRGVQTYRKTKTEKKRRTGRQRCKNRAEEEVWIREMPHLRIVPDWLWTAANKAIDARILGVRQPRGDDHPLTNVPRNSRGPCSNIFICGICKAKMHLSVRAEGGYRCSAAEDRTCWNRATCLREFTDQPIGDAIIKCLQQLGSEIDRLVSTCTELLSDGADRDARRLTLTREICELEEVVKNLNDRLEGIDDAPTSTLLRIKERENELFERRNELQGLAEQSRYFTPPTKAEIQERIDDFIVKFTTMNPNSRDDLKSLVGVIPAIPHRQFGSDKIILRAKFDIRLGALLPSRTRAALAGLFDDPGWSRFEYIPVTINLCELSSGPAHGLAAFALRDDLGPTDIGKRFGITKRKACLAIAYGRQLHAAGLTDPFLEVTSEPAKASRWGRRAPKEDGTSP